MAAPRRLQEPEPGNGYSSAGEVLEPAVASPASPVVTPVQAVVDKDVSSESMDSSVDGCIGAPNGGADVAAASESIQIA